LGSSNPKDIVRTERGRDKGSRRGSCEAFVGGKEKETVTAKMNSTFELDFDAIDLAIALIRISRC
jgi:NADPH-dependent glutamate synthase beta subunit-like oxidoreductase